MQQHDITFIQKIHGDSLVVDNPTLDTKTGCYDPNANIVKACVKEEPKDGGAQNLPATLE